MKKLNSIQFYGMPLPIYAFFAIIVLACAYFNIIPNQMIGAVAVLFAFGILICRIVLGGDFSDIVTRWHPMGR